MYVFLTFVDSRIHLFRVEGKENYRNDSNRTAARRFQILLERHAALLE